MIFWLGLLVSSLSSPVMWAAFGAAALIFVGGWFGEAALEGRVSRGRHRDRR